jgi:amidase
LERRCKAVLGGRLPFVCLPTTSSVAWPVDARLSEITESYSKSALLASIGGSLGAPEVSLPLAASDGLPVGLSLLGSIGADEALLGFSQAVAEESI